MILWKRLVGIHERCTLRHSNLSGIKSADVCLLDELRRRNSDNLHQHWLSTNAICAFTVEEFYPWGSFVDIIIHKVDSNSPKFGTSIYEFALSAIKDIVNGITFLHSGKKPIFLRFI